MKLFVIIFVVLSVQVLECRSFDFGSWLWGSNKAEEQDLPEKLSERELRGETEESHDSLEELLKQELNESDHLNNTTPEPLSEHTVLNDSFEINSVLDKSLNKSHAGETESSSVQSQTDELFMLQNMSSEYVNVTEGGLNMTVISNENQNDSATTHDPEDVVLGTEPSTFTSVTRTIYRKTIDWMADTYTLSILIPVASGILFALTIIIVIATYRCISRKYRRRRFRKRVLPESIKNLRPSDQARLLGDCCDSSGDEF